MILISYLWASNFKFLHFLHGFGHGAEDAKRLRVFSGHLHIDDGGNGHDSWCDPSVMTLKEVRVGSWAPAILLSKIPSATGGHLKESSRPAL